MSVKVRIEKKSCEVEPLHEMVLNRVSIKRPVFLTVKIWEDICRTAAQIVDDLLPAYVETARKNTSDTFYLGVFMKYNGAERYRPNRSRK